MQVAINVAKLFFHLSIFLVVLEFALRVSSSPGLPVNRSQSVVRGSIGWIQIERVPQKDFGFLRVVSRHADLRQSYVGVWVVGLQFERATVVLFGFLQIVGLK